MKKGIIFLASIFCSIVFYGQSRIVYGQVKRYNSDINLSNIYFKVEGLPDSIESDEDGNFTLIVPDSIKILKFDIFGDYKLKRVDSSKNQNMIVLYLTSNYPEIFDMNLEQLMKLNVVTASIHKQSIFKAPSNIKVISGEDIENNGYRTLVDICQDLPGFDFLLYNDGGGEYPTFNMNRGLGTVGNSDMLIMVDGIVQNNISYNWSMLWTYANMFMDLDRIEIIEGPGSALYGAQAFSGVINFITKKQFNGIKIRPFYGSNDTRALDFYAGKVFNDDISFSVAFHKYMSSGDDGNRYDPGGYFHNLRYPDTILANYDIYGNYITDVPNIKGGQKILPGFNDGIDATSARFRLNIKNTVLGAFYWDNEQGGGSYLCAYEYNLRDKDFKHHFSGLDIYMNNKINLTNTLRLSSYIVYRNSDIKPITGFKYLYKFPNLTKNYVSYSTQTYIEERLFYDISDKHKFLAGTKATYSVKMPRLVSLGSFPNNTNFSSSSWEEANAGKGLGISEQTKVYFVREFAVYALFNSTWNEFINSSIGLRYDLSSEYGHIFNPRFAIIFNKNHFFTLKLLAGRAFRQPSIYELTDEFRGNRYLKPEKIMTYEAEMDFRLLEKSVFWKNNFYFSYISDFIGKRRDTLMPSGEKFINEKNFKTAGFSSDLNYNVNKNFSLYVNYFFMLSKCADSLPWCQIERTAKNKINFGFRISALRNRLIVDWRFNIVGKRKAPQTNIWLQKYENGYAPAYWKANLAVDYKISHTIKLQFLVYNVFNEQYYGVGRETGRGFVDDYNYQTNINPAGFSPAYHPQPGRTIYFNLTFSFF